MSPDDTDGDSSVESDDVVDSHYPVKPRRSIRIVDRDDIGEFDKLDNVSFEIEEALKLIKQLFISNSLLFEAENRREDLEIMSQVIYFNQSYLLGLIKVYSGVCRALLIDC